MTETFAGRAVVVIGAARGIGAATSSLFAERGAGVVLVDPLPEAVDVARSLPAAAAAVVGDASDPTVLAKAFDAAASMHGELSTLVYAPYHDPSTPLRSTTPETWDRTLEIGVTGAWRAAVAFADASSQTAASIVLVSSIHAYQAYPGHAAYGTAKAALLGLTRALAAELGGSGIRCNAVAPSFIAVERNRHVWSDPGARADVVARNPLRRLGGPDDVSRVVAFLASDDAAHVNGVCVPVDGGELAVGP